MLVTFATQKGLKSQQDEWVFYLSLLLLNPWMKSYDVTIYMNSLWQYFHMVLKILLSM